MTKKNKKLIQNILYSIMDNSTVLTEEESFGSDKSHDEEFPDIGEYKCAVAYDYSEVIFKPRYTKDILAFTIIMVILGGIDIIGLIASITIRFKDKKNKCVGG